MRWILVLLSAVLLTGCAGYGGYGGYRGGYYPYARYTTTLQQANRMTGAQQPVEYRVGFMAGCDSGYVTAGNTAYTYQKDRERYNRDPLYRDGWDAGFRQCQMNAPPTYYAAPPRYSPGYFYGSGYYSPRSFFSFGYYAPYAYYPYSYYSYWPGLSFNFGRHRHHHHHHHKHHRHGRYRRR